MMRRRPVSRRAFLAQVTGAAVLAGCAPLGSGEATGQRRQMVIDMDPADPARPVRHPPVEPAPPPPEEGTNVMAEEPVVTSQPRERFIFCPGHQRCPR